MRQPGKAVHHIENMFIGGIARIADEDARDINREKTATAEKIGESEKHQPTRSDKQGV